MMKKQGRFILYDAEYASTSLYGWLEIMKISTKEWAVLECYPDGSADYKTFEKSKKIAISVAKRIAKATKTMKPYYIDHGIKYYNKQAY